MIHSFFFSHIKRGTKHRTHNMRTMTKNTTSTRMRTTTTILAALSFLLTPAAMMLAFFPATTTTEAWAPTTRSSRRNSRSVAAATRLHGMSVDQLLASPSLQDWTTLETYNSMDDDDAAASSSEYADGVLDVDVLLQAPLAAAGAISPITTTHLMNTPSDVARMESTTVRQQEATTTAAAAAVTTAELRIYGII